MPFLVQLFFKTPTHTPEFSTEVSSVFTGTCTHNKLQSDATTRPRWETSITGAALRSVWHRAGIEICDENRHLCAQPVPCFNGCAGKMKRQIIFIQCLIQRSALTTEKNPLVLFVDIFVGKPHVFSPKRSISW